MPDGFFICASDDSSKGRIIRIQSNKARYGANTKIRFLVLPVASVNMLLSTKVSTRFPADFLLTFKIRSTSLIDTIGCRNSSLSKISAFGPLRPNFLVIVVSAFCFKPRILGEQVSFLSQPNNRVSLLYGLKVN